MFTFGILSSHLPYVAFIAFYIFYFFFPSALAKHDNEMTGIPEEKIFPVDSVHQSAQTEQSSAGYFQHLAELQKQEENISPQYRLLSEIPIPDDNRKPGIRFYSFVFSRPPPVL